MAVNTGATFVGHGRGDPTKTSKIYEALAKLVEETPPVSPNVLTGAARVQKRLNATARQEYETKSATLFRILGDTYSTLSNDEHKYLNYIIDKSIEIDRINKLIGQLSKSSNPAAKGAIDKQMTALKRIYDYNVDSNGKQLLKLIEKIEKAPAAKLPRREGGARRTRKHRGRKMRKTRHTRR